MTIFDRLKEALTENWHIKLTALVLATVLWAVVAAEEPAIESMKIAVTVDLPDGRSLEQEPRPVDVTFSGPARELFKLYATPATIRKAVPDTAADSNYTLHLAPTDVELPENVAVRIQDLRPRSVVVRLRTVGRPHRNVEPPADAGGASERVLMGVPVVVRSEHSGVWWSDPPAVIVTVRGPAARLTRLTRDSVEVAAVPAGAGGPETVRLEVLAPAGVEGASTPDTAVVQRRSRG